MLYALEPFWLKEEIHYGRHFVKRKQDTMMLFLYVYGYLQTKKHLADYGRPKGSDHPIRSLFVHHQVKASSYIKKCIV